MLVKGECLWPLILYQSSDLKSFMAEGFLPSSADGESEVLRMGLTYLRLMGVKGHFGADILRPAAVFHIQNIQIQGIFLCSGWKTRISSKAALSVLHQ